MNDRFKIRVWDKVFNRYWTDEEIKENATWLLFPDNDNINNVEIEQRTGLKDKNGKLIYEGDIVKIHSITGIVVRDEYGFLFKMGDVCEPLRHFENAKKTFEVIGNIHE